MHINYFIIFLYLIPKKSHSRFIQQNFCGAPTAGGGGAPGAPLVQVGLMRSYDTCTRGTKSKETISKIVITKKPLYE